MEHLNRLFNVFAPFNPLGTHRILLYIRIEVEVLVILDPVTNILVENIDVAEKATAVATKLLNQKFKGELSNVCIFKLLLQKNSDSCGVLCCFYALQLLKGNFSF